MEYKKLLSLFRQDETAWNELYTVLYNFPLTQHINIPIKQLQATKEFPAFFYYTGDITFLLSDIISELSTLTHTVDLLPPIAINHFRRSCLIEEIQSSNDIEGVHSSRKEINFAIDEQTDIANAKNVRLWGIVNKYLKLQNKENINFITSKDVRAFYNDFMLDEVCRDDPQNAPDGKYFRTQSVEVWSKTKVIHQGVCPEAKIIDYMDKALNVLHDNSIPSLIRISIFHYLFGYIHPFYDGNGRMSRFITSYYLSQTLNPLVALRLSLTIKKSLRLYYKLFEDTNAYGNRGDLTPFITGFLWLILKSITRVNELLEEKAAQLRKYSKKLKELNLKKTRSDIYFILLQATLFSIDGATINEIANTMGVGARTVRNQISDSPQGHILVNTIHRAHRYKLNRDILE